MAAEPGFSKVGLVKSYLLPALITFLIPGFGLWFFDHVESSYDQRIREGVVSQMRTDQRLTEAQRARAIEFFETHPVSKILTSNDERSKSLHKTFEHLETRYAIFRWMKRIALVCLATGVGAFVAVGVGVLLSFRSQTAQYWSLRLGWNVLRWFAVIQVLGQGVLAIALSFWMTAFWAERYYVKLILVAGIFAFCAAALLIKAIFRKLPAHTEFAGRLVTKEAAPALWSRVSQMAERLGIAPPDNIFVGIDDNFFVTEHAVKVGGQHYSGRTLFASLSLLKTLSRSEADAVLAHELAHFSGEDTIYGRRTSPLLGKYVHYMEALYQGGISRPLFHFMFFFWNLYQLSLSKLRRQREFRADRIGAELTSPQDIAQSLVKIAAYCQYRGKIQNDLFGKEQNVETMDVFHRIEQGFPAFINDCLSGSELAESGTPHPFDSHPPLGSRLQNIGLDLQTVQSTLKSNTLPAVTDSWFSAIEGAAAFEAEQWKEFEDEFHKVHQESLAWRFKPEGETEIQHVVKFFPPVEIKTKSGLTVTLDYEKLTVSDWDSPLLFESITKCRIDETLGKKLVIDNQIGGQSQKARKINLKDFTDQGANLMQTFQHYYGRHLTAKKYLAEKSSAASTTADKR